MNKWIAISLLWVALGCGGGTPAPAEPQAPSSVDQPAPAATTEPATPPAAGGGEPGITSCDDACTEIAVCYEEIYEADYRNGGACVDSCEELTDAERATYFACLDAAADCETTMEC